MTKFAGAALYAAALASLAACALQGPRTAGASRLAYNEAVQASEQQELVLNLVRLRYTDAPEFFAVSSISTQMRFEAGASLGAAVGADRGTRSSLLTPGLEATYAELPTVVLTPQRSPEFTRQLVTPIQLDSLFLLTRYGWSFEETLPLLADNVNGIENPTFVPAGQPISSDREFLNMASSLQALADRHLVRMDVLQVWDPVSAPIPEARVSAQDLLNAAQSDYRYEYHPDSASYVLSEAAQHYVIRVSPAAREDAELAALRQVLGLRSGESTYEIDAREWPQTPSDLSVRIATRSVLGAMEYLSRGVELPPAHVERGLARAQLPAGERWAPRLSIHHAQEAPDSAFVAVQYQGYWFFIDESDLDSKRTLALLTSLLRLEIGTGGAQTVPILTLPVGR
jgi:hypothetical protein